MDDLVSESVSLKQTFPVFLSSLFRRAPGLADLRAKIYHEVGLRRYVYVDEQVHPRDIARQDDLEAADELIFRVRDAEVFICILAGSSHGSLIKVGGFSSSSSFFEIELYQAALLQKKVHVFVRNDFSPEPRLEALLRVLRDAFPEWKNVKGQTDSEILAGVKQIAESEVGHSARRAWLVLRAPIDLLVQALYAARGRNRPTSTIYFLNGDTDESRGEPRVEVIKPLVHDIGRQVNEERRLSRLWVALRELMALDHEVLRDKELLGYWNWLLGEWARAGAWYGLHADTPLGCLAALNSLTKVRSRLAALFPESAESRDIPFPGGALASSKYSIAKHLYVKQDRIARFNEALSDLKRSLDTERVDKSGLLAIRGSILRQLGQSSDCIRDYEEVLRLRRETNAPPNQVGEALSELGYAYVLQLGTQGKGLRFCEEGVEMLRQGGRPGFLARGLRKLAVAYLVNGRLLKAHETRQEARDFAGKSGTLDQLQ